MLSIHVRRTTLVAAEKAIQPWADLKPYLETIRLGDARIVWHLALTCECLQQKPVQDQPRPDDRVQQAGRSGSAGSAAASREEPPRWTSRARGLARPTQSAAPPGDQPSQPVKAKIFAGRHHAPHGPCTSQAAPALAGRPTSEISKFERQCSAGRGVAWPCMQPLRPADRCDRGACLGACT